MGGKVYKKCESCKDSEEVVESEIHVVCETCNGFGRLPEDCPECSSEAIVDSCELCNNEGYIFIVCPSCNGRGTI